MLLPIQIALQLVQLPCTTGLCNRLDQYFFFISFRQNSYEPTIST